MTAKRFRAGKSISSELIANVTSASKEQIIEFVRRQHVEVMKLPEKYSGISEEIDRMGYSILRTGYRVDEYCRVLSGRCGSNPRIIDLSAALRTLWEKTEVLFRKKNLGFYCELPQKPVFAEVDEERLYYAVLELILNAAQNSPSGTRVRIVLSKTRKYARITICDKGEGMDEKVILHCFEPFYKGNAENESAMGLGLTIVRHFASENGGRINVRSEKGKGTSVSMLIPLIEDDSMILKAEAHSKEILGGKFSPVYIMLSDIGE